VAYLLVSAKLTDSQAQRCAGLAGISGGNGGGLSVGIFSTHDRIGIAFSPPASALFFGASISAAGAAKLHTTLLSALQTEPSLALLVIMFFDPNPEVSKYCTSNTIGALTFATTSISHRSRDHFELGQVDRTVDRHAVSETRL
jgi:hypothetical protein